MRHKIVMIVALFAVMMIMGIASAKPEINKVKLDINPDNNLLDVTVGVVTDSGVVSTVETNYELMTPINNGEWKKNGIGKGIIEIKATDDKGLATTKLYGSGGCTGDYTGHDDLYNYANIRPIPNPGSTTTFYLDTYYNINYPTASIIGICIYPDPDFNPNDDVLNIADSLKEKWVPKHSGNHGYFGFGRIHGEDTIALSGDLNIMIGTANYGQVKDSSQILMHIYDPFECRKGDNGDDEESPNNEETCWRRPGTPPPGIPEFPTVALPIAAVIGLVFFFQHKKKKED